MYDVYLSYSLKDKKTALDVKQKLNDSGLSVWMADEKIIDSGNFEANNKKAMAISKVVLLLLTDNLQDSLGVTKDINLALNKNKKILYLKLEDFKSKQYLEDQEVFTMDNFSRLVEEIRYSEYRSGINIFNFLSFPPDEISKAFKHSVKNFIEDVKDDKKVSFKAATLTVLILTLATALIIYNENHVSIDFNKCVTYETYGINGYGFIEGNIDFSSLSQSTQRKLDKKNIFEEDFIIEFSKEDNLLNGDKVNINISSTLDLSKENVKLKHNNTSKKVENLQEGTPIDPFEYVSLHFEGLDGQGVATIETKQNDFNLMYILDNNYCLSVGDEVGLTVNFNKEELASKGYGLTRIKKTFVVDKLDEMLSSTDQVSASALDILSSEVNDLIDEKINSEYSPYGENRILSVEVGEDSAYLIYLKEDRYDENENAIVFLKPISVNVSTFYGMGKTVNKKFYARAVLFNIFVSPDGQLKYDSSNNEIRYYEDYETLKGCVEALYSEKYNIEALYNK